MSLMSAFLNKFQNLYSVRFGRQASSANFLSSMSTHERYSNEQLVLPLIREFKVAQELTYSAADIYSIPFEDLFLLYLISSIKETIVKRGSTSAVHRSTNTPSSASVPLLTTEEKLQFQSGRSIDPPVKINVTISEDINVFFQQYDFCGLTIGDLRAIKNKYDTNPNNGDVSSLRSKLFYPVFSSHQEKAFSEAYLESYLFRTAMDPITVLLHYMFEKNNEGLTAADVDRAYSDIVSQLRAHSVKEPNPKKSTPLTNVQELVSAQGSLQRFGLKAVADIIHYVGLTDTIIQDFLRLDPLILKTVVEVKKEIFTYQNMSAFKQSRRRGSLNYPNLFKEPRYHCGLEKVFYKLLRQLFETGCDRGIICDQSKIMFIQLSVDSPENHGVIRDQPLKVDIMGPFEIHSTENLTRCMILAFFLPGVKEDKSFKGLVQRLLRILNVGKPDDRTTDNDQSMFEENTCAQNKGTTTVGQQPFDTTGSQSHVAQTQIPLDAEDSKDDEQEISSSSEGSSNQSNIAHYPLTGSTSAPSTGKQIELKEVSTEINFTGSSPERIEPLFKSHFIPFNAIEKELISSGSADVYFIDVSILDYLGGYTLMNKDKAIEKGLTISHEVWPSGNSKQCLLLKIISPKAWSYKFTRKFKSSGLDPDKWSYDSIVHELKRLARVDRYCQERKLRPIVPQIIGFGKLQDTNDVTYHNGYFMITTYAGHTLSENEAVSLEPNIKSRVIKNFKTLHRSEILHNDIRLPNIAFNDVDWWPTVLDLGNSIELSESDTLESMMDMIMEIDLVKLEFGLETSFDAD